MSFPFTRNAAAALALAFVLAAVPAAQSQALPSYTLDSVTPTTACPGTVVSVAYSSGFLLPNASDAVFVDKPGNFFTAEITNIVDFKTGDFVVPDVTAGEYRVDFYSSAAPMGSVSFTVTECEPELTLTVDRASIGPGEVATFLGNPKEGTLGAVFVDRAPSYYGPTGLLNGEAGLLAWEELGGCTSTTITLRLYDNELDTEPTWDTPYAASASVTLLADEGPDCQSNPTPSNAGSTVVESAAGTLSATG